MKTTKRKTAKEIKLQEYLRGFYGCLELFESAFRDEAWKEDARRRRLGLSTLISETSKEPRIDALWSVIEKAQKKISPIDTEYKDLRLARSNVHSGLSDE
jgi:hypothetical protein